MGVDPGGERGRRFVLRTEEVELVQEIADVDAAERVHLREWEDGGESHFVDGPVGRVPGYVDHLFEFLGVLDRHGHVIVCAHDLDKVLAEALLEKFGVFVEEDQDEVGHSRGVEVEGVHCLDEERDEVLDFEEVFGVVDGREGLGHDRDALLTE